MKKALVLGAAGFVGSYLIKHLHNDCGYEVFATKLPQEKIEDVPAKIYDLNILEKESIISLFYELRPDYVFHLAAQSSVSVAWNNPQLTIDINIKVNEKAHLVEVTYIIRTEDRHGPRGTRHPQPQKTTVAFCSIFGREA